MNTGLFDLYKTIYSKLSHPYLSLGHSTVVDWILEIGVRDGIGSDAERTTIVKVQDCDLDYVLAKGEIALKDWLIEHNGGY
jgi:hypothetical protein